MKKIAVVTGGCGFIGSHMVDYLIKKKFFVKIIDNLSGGTLENISHLKKDQFKLFKLNIVTLKDKPQIFEKAKYVFHFAGKGDIVPSIEKPVDYIETNANGTLNVLMNAKKYKISKFVYAASSSCYGITKEIPTSENAPINPLYPYALSKNIGEQLVLHWGNVYGLKVMSLRIFNAYGLRSKTSGAYGSVIGTFLKQKISNMPLTVVGNGTQKRDFVNVKDLVAAFYLAADSKLYNRVYNVGFGKPKSVNELVNLLKCKIIRLPKRPGEPDITHANINKIKKELKWKPIITFKDGINELLSNINYWNQAPLWTKNKIKIATKVWFQYLK